MKPKVLVTGAAGFIGRYVIEEFRRRNIDYIAIDMKKPENVPESQFEKVLLSEKEKLTEVIARTRPTAILHMAAIASVTHGNIGEIYVTNVCGTENLLEAVQDTGIPGVRVVLISTAGVYGNQDSPQYGETLGFAPSNHYSYSKMVTEILSRNYTDAMDIKIVRPFNIVGSGQSELFFTPKLVRAFKERQPELCLGNISSMRDYVDVNYTAKILAAMLISADIPENIYNICTGIGHTGEQVIEKLEQITGHHPKITISSSIVRKQEVWRLVGAPGRIESFRMKNGIAKPPSLNEILQNMLSD